MEVELLVFMVEKAGTSIDSEDSMIAVGLDVNTPLQPVTQADRTKRTKLSLPEFIKAQATNAFCHSSAGQLEKAGAKTRSKRHKFLCDARTLAEPYKTRVAVIASTDSRLSTLHHFIRSSTAATHVRHNASELFLAQHAP